MSIKTCGKLGIVFLHHRGDEVTLNNLESFRRWNPEATIVTMSGGEPLPGGYSIDEIAGWTERWREHTRKGDLRARSTDLLVYAWYQNRKEQCERWMLVEWDSYCACPVEEYFGELMERDVVASSVHFPKEEGESWWWFCKRESLPEAWREHAAGLAPFSFILISDKALSVMCSNLPAGDFGNGNGELRFASLACASGFEPVANHAATGHNGWRPLPKHTPISRGMWHPVKWLVRQPHLDSEQRSHFRSHRQIINWLIARRGYTSYLEIGAGDGSSFVEIRCKHKENVNPDPCADGGPTYRMTSETFFARNHSKYDLIFIDGLHHADVVERDLESSLAALTPGGSVVCHNLNPRNEGMQAIPRRSRDWTGDCWKAWVKLRSKRDDLLFAVADIDHGVGVILKDAQWPSPLLDVGAADLNWHAFTRHRREWLPLVPPGKFAQALSLAANERTEVPLTVVTLWRSEWKDAQQAVFKYLQEEHFPAGTHFVWTVEAGSRTSSALESGWEGFDRQGRDYSVEVIETELLPKGGAREKHMAVAALYNESFRSLESEMVFSVEDDVVPLVGTFAKLCCSLAGNPQAAALMGAYRTRQRHDSVCAGNPGGSYFSWSIAGRPELVCASWIAAGLTLYRTERLRKCLPAFPEAADGWIKGWDMVVSQRLRDLGDHLLLDAECVAEHHYG